MKFTINIKDSKVAYFFELLKKLDFVDLEESDDFEDFIISDKERNILDQRLTIYKNGSSKLLNWEDVKKEIS
jgi:hypothetical protein